MRPSPFQNALSVVALATMAVALAVPSRNLDDEPVTFSDKIWPIVSRKCTPCHTEGGPAPFPLKSYLQVKKRGELVSRMMLTRQMPPCYGGSDFGEFCASGGSVTDEEGVLVQKWLSAGGPEGRPVEAEATPDPARWRLGPPDAVLASPTGNRVKVEGRPYWMAVPLELGPHRGRRIRAVDFRARQPLAVRNAQFGLAKPDLQAGQVERGGFETGGSIERFCTKLLGAWAPGYHPWQLPPGVSMRLDADRLLVHPLYMPRGREEDAGFEVALYFSDEESDKEPEWLRIGDDRFAVPAPGALLLEPTATLPPGSRVIGVIPEARFFCTYLGVLVGEKELFGSRRWEPYWTGAYCFAEPVAFPEGATLQGRFQFDNDIHMGRNEGTRPVPIVSGDEEKDEMARIHVLYVR